MTRIAYFDCFSGISGDMALGALVDLDEESGRSVLESVVEALGLEEEVTIAIGRAARGHVGGALVEVRAGDGSVRSLPELKRLVAEAEAIPDRARRRSLDALDRLGRVESSLHGVPADEVHLHELGGADTLVDLVGAFWLLDALGVEEAFASPLPYEHGLKGELPLPAPAALQLLTEAGAWLEPSEARVELVTPTGAAILAVCARFQRPAMKPARIGYGAGGRDLPGNLLRVWLGELQAGVLGDQVTVLETNLDDLPGNLVAALVEDLMQAGALDVSVAPALMKKGRPGQLVTVIAEPGRAAALTDLLLRSSSTLGVRVTETRRVLAQREVVEVETEIGAARVKVKYLDGRPVEWAPEYEDARRLARRSGRALRDVMRLVTEAARRS